VRYAWIVEHREVYSTAMMACTRPSHVGRLSGTATRRKLSLRFDAPKSSTAAAMVADA
jgi:hypothetical protein